MLRRLSVVRFFEHIPRLRCNQCVLIFILFIYFDLSRKSLDSNLDTEDITHNKKMYSICHVAQMGLKAIWPDNFANFEKIANKLRKHKWGNTLKKMWRNNNQWQNCASGPWVTIGRCVCRSGVTGDATPTWPVRRLCASAMVNCKNI